MDTESVEEVAEFDGINGVYAITDPIEYNAEFEDLEVKLSNDSTVSSKVTSMEMETDGVLKVIPSDEEPLSTLFKYGNRSLEYLSFAVGTGIYADELQLYTDLNEPPVDAYYTLPDYTENRSSTKAEYLFSPNRADFETTLQNWVDHCEIAPEVHQNYRLLIHRSNLSPRLRFLTTVIALEAYYDSEYENETMVPEEEFCEIQSEIMQVVPDDTDLQNQIYGLLENVANSPSIKDKLENIMNGEREVIETFFDISELASKARRERNEVAHGSSEATTIEYETLSRKLQLVLETILARKIGVPAEIHPNALASRYQGLMQQLNIHINQVIE